MKKNIFKSKKTFKAQFVCHECWSQITINEVEYFKSIIHCPFCGKRMWLAYLKDKEYWTPKCVESSIKNWEKEQNDAKN